MNLLIIDYKMLVLSFLAEHLNWIHACNQLVFTHFVVVVVVVCISVCCSVVAVCLCVLSESAMTICFVLPLLQGNTTTKLSIGKR